MWSHLSFPMSGSESLLLHLPIMTYLINPWQLLWSLLQPLRHVGGWPPILYMNNEKSLPTVFLFMSCNVQSQNWTEWPAPAITEARLGIQGWIITALRSKPRYLMSITEPPALLSSKIQARHTKWRGRGTPPRNIELCTFQSVHCKPA